MRLPWVPRAQHEELKDLAARQLADRDKRIEALEAERRKLLDYIAERGFGGLIFAQTPQVSMPDSGSSKEAPTQPVPLRPSAIMAQQSRLAATRYRNRLHPSHENESLAASAQFVADMGVPE